MVTFELPDSGNYGFALPADLINETVIETVEGLTSLLKPNKKRFVKLSAFTGSDSAAGILYDLPEKYEAKNAEPNNSNGPKLIELTLYIIFLILIYFCF